jgi:riboflavin kinase
LNLALSEESTKHKKQLTKVSSKKVCPAKGYCSGLLFNARIGNLECAIVLPHVTGYPEELLEVIAPLYLRDALQLQDGSEVTVTVNL